MSEKLKPCPFCGGEAVVFNYDKRYAVVCTQCEALTGWNIRFDHGVHKSRQKAIDEWNERVPEDKE